MRVSPLLVLPLLWSLTLSQHTVPYVSFMGQILANHSYVDISLVGYGYDSVQCHTDLSTCCSAAQGNYRGDWFPPNGGKNRLPFSNEAGNIYEQRTAQRIDIRLRANPAGLTGVYRCDIPTVAVHNNVFPQYPNNSLRETVYVGLYTSGGG